MKKILLNRKFLLTLTFTLFVIMIISFVLTLQNGISTTVTNSVKSNILMINNVIQQNLNRTIITHVKSNNDQYFKVLHQKLIELKKMQPYLLDVNIIKIYQIDKKTKTIRIVNAYDINDDKFVYFKNLSTKEEKLVESVLANNKPVFVLQYSSQYDTDVYSLYVKYFEYQNNIYIINLQMNKDLYNEQIKIFIQLTSNFIIIIILFTIIIYMLLFM